MNKIQANFYSWSQKRAAFVTPAFFFFCVLSKFFVCSRHHSSWHRIKRNKNTFKIKINMYEVLINHSRFDGTAKYSGRFLNMSWQRLWCLASTTAKFQKKKIVRMLACQSSSNAWYKMILLPIVKLVVEMQRGDVLWNPL